ncbi:uncharacterized protein VP01_9274g1, partial [Puccinia sorghi]
LRGFLQSCKLLFSNDPTVFSDDRNKFLYAASYLSGTASQLFKPYMDLLKNQSPSFQSAEFELNSLSMKDNGNASNHIAQFWTLQSRVDWNDAAFAFHFRKGLPSCITNQLALTGQQLKMLQQLIN